MTEQPITNIRMFEERFFPRLAAWRKKMEEQWEGKRCDLCGSDNALAWCPNRLLIECRFCGGYVRGSQYVLGRKK